MKTRFPFNHPLFEQLRPHGTAHEKGIIVDPDAEPVKTLLADWRKKNGVRAGSRGLGDTIAKAIQVATLGIVKPCEKCKERQAKLNRLVPY